MNQILKMNSEKKCQELTQTLKAFKKPRTRFRGLKENLERNQFFQRKVNGKSITVSHLTLLTMEMEPHQTLPSKRMKMFPLPQIVSKMLNKYGVTTINTITIILGVNQNHIQVHLERLAMVATAVAIVVTVDMADVTTGTIVVKQTVMTLALRIMIGGTT